MKLGLRLVALSVAFTMLMPHDAYPSFKSGAPCKKSGEKVKIGGTQYICIKQSKKLIWTKVTSKRSDSKVKASSTTPTPTPTPTPSQSNVQRVPTWLQSYRSEYVERYPLNNPVTLSIEKKIPSLRQPTANPDIASRFETIGEIPQDAMDSLRLQHKYLLEAFPEVKLPVNDKYLVFDSRVSARARADEWGCLIVSQLKNPRDPIQSMWSGTTGCYSNNQSFLVAFIDWSSFATFDPMPLRAVSNQDMWAYQAGQELTGGSIQLFYNNSRRNNVWSPLPAWYEQGGQFTLSSIALAVHERKWRQPSLVTGRFEFCGGGKELENSSRYDADSSIGNCHYTLGAMGTELLVALYGFDAPIAWFKEINLTSSATATATNLEWERSFLKAFGDTLPLFYEWADAYIRYLENGTALPSQLLTRLNSN